MDQSGLFEDSYCRRSSTQERTIATDKGTSSDWQYCIENFRSSRSRRLLGVQLDRLTRPPSNTEIGNASKKIAEASSRDSAAMKAIAEDSKKVASLTRRDSTNMRITAAVTLLFLPGTFTAVR